MKSLKTAVSQTNNGKGCRQDMTDKMIIELDRAAEIISLSDDILILTHANPDGDTLGSAAAMCLALTQLGKRSRIENSDEIPHKYSYLFEKIENADFEPRFIMSVDVADKKLLGDLEEKYEGKIALSIDHHGSNRLFADETCVDAGSASTTELILKLLKLLKVDITPEIANAVYTGLATDTGCFRFMNTTANTHAAAAEMMTAGADHVMINKLMFETKSFSYMKLEKRGLEGLTMHFDGRVAVISLTGEDFRISGASQQDCDAICGIPRQIEGVDIGITMREKAENLYKISVRTNGDFNASAVCQLLGGGGHKGAAGCEIRGTLEEAKKAILGAVGEYIGA